MSISHLFCSASGQAIKEQEVVLLTALSKAVSAPDSAYTALSFEIPAKLQGTSLALVDARKNMPQIQELLAYLASRLVDKGKMTTFKSLLDSPVEALNWLFVNAVTNSLVFQHKNKDFYLKFSVVSAQHALAFEVSPQEQLSLFQKTADFSTKAASQLQYARKNEDLAIIVDYSVEESITHFFCELASPLCVKEDYPWSQSNSIQAIKSILTSHVYAIADPTEKIENIPRKVSVAVFKQLYQVLKYAATLSIVAGALSPARVLIKSNSEQIRPGRAFT